MTKAARYTGKPEKTQVGGGNWLSPGDVIAEPRAMVDALLDRNDFEEVDLSLPPKDVEPELDPEEELPVEEDFVAIDDDEEDEEE